MDRPVKVLLRSKDVLHDFAVPQFRVKMDLVPGTGKLCLVYTHTNRQVRHLVYGVVRHRALYDARPCGGRYRRGLRQLAGRTTTWSDIQGYPAVMPLPAGTPMRLRLLPRPAGRGQRCNERTAPGRSARLVCGATAALLQAGIRGAHKDDIYGQQMAPMAGILLDDAGSANVTAYIAAWKRQPTSNTLGGDPESRSLALYQLRRLPRRTGTGQLCLAGTTTGRPGGLVPETPAGKFPAAAYAVPTRQTTTAIRWC